MKEEEEKKNTMSLTPKPCLMRRFVNAFSLTGRNIMFLFSLIFFFSSLDSGSNVYIIHIITFEWTKLFITLSKHYIVGTFFFSYKLNTQIVM